MCTDLIYCVNIRLKDFGTKFNLKGKSCFEGFHDFIDLIFTEQYALQFWLDILCEIPSIVYSLKFNDWII